MWKKDDVRPQTVPENPGPSSPVKSQSFGIAPGGPSAHATAPVPLSPNSAACISKGIRIKGDVTGSEDLFVDGLVEGKLSLTNGSLTIGPNGNVKADVSAREVIVRGRIDGKVSGRDKVHLWGTSQVTGEVQTERLAIEEGALLRGKVEAGKLVAKAPEARSTTPSAGSKSSDVVPTGSGSAAD